MSSRTVNLALLTILTIEMFSGLASYLVGTTAGQWVFWVHRIGAFALVPVLALKLSIVVRSYRRRGLTVSTSLSGLLGLMFIAAFMFGLLWSTTGVRGFEVPILGALTGLGIHVALAFACLPLLLLHVVEYWGRVRARRPDFASRRAAIRYLALSTIGLAAWRGSETISAAVGWSGAERRFTGSREIGSFSGNRFPATNWFSDPKPAIDSSVWTLRIHGAVEREAVIAWDDLPRFRPATIRAVLDCTGGWCTEQDWSGVPVLTLLERAGLARSAASLVFTSATGYSRRYPLHQVDELLLATHVGSEPLTRGHGYPVRLVAPGRRGYEWVKWVVAIEVSELPGWLESPLPLQ